MENLSINRAPVLTLWAAVVAERLGFERDEALTLGKAVAGLTAQSKGQRLGIFARSPRRCDGSAPRKRAKRVCSRWRCSGARCRCFARTRDSAPWAKIRSLWRRSVSSTSSRSMASHCRRRVRRW